MIGLDTNVIVRYVAQDDRSQAAAATRLMEIELTAESPGFIPLVVLAEVVWVLAGAYDASRATIIRVLEGLLSSPQLRVEQAEAAWLALLDFREARSSVEFSDALIARVASRAGCARTMTFDRRAARSPGFELLR